MPLKLSELSDFITCSLCGGYLIDATTVNECLHTFCKSCIVKHIKNEDDDDRHKKCPKCHTVIHERRPMDYIICDRNKQDIVYKLVPQLYITELTNRIQARETEGLDEVTRYFIQSKLLYVVLIQKRNSLPNLLSNPRQLDAQASHSEANNTNDNTIYLRCPFTVKVKQLRKLLIIKYQLGVNDKITMLYKGDIIDDEDQVSNLAQTLMFCIQFIITPIR